jgi:hypothetical protein
MGCSCGNSKKDAHAHQLSPKDVLMTDRTEKPSELLTLYELYQIKKTRFVRDDFIKINTFFKRKRGF